RLPFFYGYVVLGVAFISLAIGVNSRTAFSLFYPEILNEFGWERGATAGVFSVGFLASTIVMPFVGQMIERFGPQWVVPLGAVLVSSGLILTTQVDSILGMYATLGALMVGGSVFLSYIGHSAFLPNWFVARRGLMLGLAFSGVGVGGIVMFPLLESYMASEGWRAGCWALAIVLLAVVVPINLLLQRGRPESMGLAADGKPTEVDGSARPREVVLDAVWAEREWTLRAIVSTPRVWFVTIAYFSSLYISYAVLVHQTKFLLDVGFSSEEAAWSLGVVGAAAIGAQLGIGYVSDRIGREWGWTLCALGYVLTFLVFITLASDPSRPLLYVGLAGLGFLGMGLAPLFSAVAAELFQGRYFGRMYGLLSLATAIGAASGTWITGALHDRFGSYVPAFWLGIALAGISIVSIWLAGPGRVRRVGRDPDDDVNDSAVGNQTLCRVGIAPTPIVLGDGETKQVQGFALDKSGARLFAGEIHFDWRVGGAGLSLHAADDVATLQAGDGFVSGTVQLIASHQGVRAVARRKVVAAGA
ncbi:MAG: MFS transporter, partial [Pseudomonadota bacterium]